MENRNKERKKGKEMDDYNTGRQNSIEQNIIDTIEQNYMPYAMSVIVSRAIPEIDGFKPSHRKLLFTMFKMGLLTGSRTKSANVVGQTMKLNPHGDAAIYETLVRLTRGNDALLHPLIDSKGNFGKQYSRDMKYAAPRYTEVKLDKICEEIFRDLDKNTVDFTDNYDGTMKEPVLLPSMFPNILVNANQGIAVGMASNICSFNLKEVCETAVMLIQNEDTSKNQFDTAQIIEYLKAPDFPAGGQIIYNKKEISEIYSSGRGSFKLRARYRHDKKNSCIEIFEIPYTTTAEAIIDSVVELVKEGKIKDIIDIRDETDLDGLNIAIDIRKSAEPEVLMNKLFKLTPLQDTFSCNFNILINGSPRVMGIKTIISEWTAFRVNCIKRQILFDIDKKSEKLHLLRGLKKILLDIDKAIRIIRNTEEDAKVIPNLMEGFDIDQTQSEFIAEIKLRNLNREYILNRIGEVDTLQKEIEELQNICKDERKIRKIIIKQLNDVSKKYGQPRRTEIVHEEHVEEITVEHLIEDFNLRLFLTAQNYIKKIPLISLRANPEQKLKDEDTFVQEIETHNKADLLLFSSKYTVYKLKIYELGDCKASSLGEFLPNLLGMEADEKIIYMTATDNYKGYMLFSFENGKMAKIDLESYSTKTNRKKLANAYSDLSPLVYAAFLENDTDLAAYSSIDKVLVFNTAAINPKSTRDSQGVQVLKEKRGSRLVGIKTIEESGLKDPGYYRANIPAIGFYLKDEDKPVKQIMLEFGK